MKQSRQVRFVAALIALFSMLFMQLAVASYACPNRQDGQPQAARAMPPDCAMNMGKVMDLEQPTLCHAQQQVGKQSLDKPSLPDVPPFVPAMLVQAIVAEGAVPLSLPSLPPPSGLARATSPPLSIRHCRFRF